MRKPAIQPLLTGKTETPPEEHFLLAQTDGAHAEARDVGRALAALLADEPALAALLPDGLRERAAVYAAPAAGGQPPAEPDPRHGPAEVARLHLLDALAALPLPGRRCPSTAIDLGSGGGVPGIPLALARPEIRWVLVDSVRKKAEALPWMVQELGLTNVAVVAAASRAPRPRDGSTASGTTWSRRAPARPCRCWPSWRCRCSAVGGTLLAWKGPLAAGDDEL